MIAFFIFMAWLALETIDVYMPPGKHSTSTAEEITQKLNSSWPLQELDNEQFFVAYKVRAGQQSSVTDKLLVTHLQCSGLVSNDNHCLEQVVCLYTANSSHPTFSNDERDVISM